MPQLNAPTPTKRRSPDGASANRHALHLVRPFIGRFEEWNHGAARASASILSRVTTEPEKARHREELAKLQTEVAATYVEFKDAVAGEPPHSRIDDVDAAFERLLAALKRAVG